MLHHLAQGHTVRVLSRNAHVDAALPSLVELHHGDLSTSDALKPFVENADVLYHCAGEIYDDSRMKVVHVDGTQNLIRAASGLIGRWVQLSSVGVYGPVQNGTVTEDSQLQPVGTYEVTKTQSDALVRLAVEQGAFEAVFLRPSNVYGPEMRNRSLYQMIAMIERGRFFFIGPSGASANYVHVDDVVAALVMCATHPNAVNKTYNISGWDTLENFVETIAQSLEKPVPKLRLPRGPILLLAAILGQLPGFPLTVARVDALCNRSRYPIDRIRNDLGFELGVSWQTGLEQLVGAMIRRVKIK